MARQVITTNGPWGFSTMSGCGIKGYEMHPAIMRSGKLFKDGQFRFQKGQLYGKVVATREEADRLSLEYGYTHLYGRNTCKFVMSRAARKRGYTTEDRMYNDRAKRGK